MADKIKKLKFKENAPLQIEVVPLDSLTKMHKANIITPHRTNFYHVFLFENCQPTHYVDFEKIKIEPYTLLFIDKDRVHQFDQLLNYEGRILIFTDDFFSESKFLRNSVLLNDLSNQATIKLNQQSLKRFISICDDISEELRLPDDDKKQAILKNHLHNFLLLAEREKLQQGSPNVKKGVDLDYTLLFRDLLETNFTKLNSVNDYSTLLFISEKRLGQATSKILGKPPKELINERILIEAKRLLVYSHLSIKEIGLELGFEDPAYFARYFKKNTETTPVEFREKHLSK